MDPEQVSRCDGYCHLDPGGKCQPLRVCTRSSRWGRVSPGGRNKPGAPAPAQGAGRARTQLHGLIWGHPDHAGPRDCSSAEKVPGTSGGESSLGKQIWEMGPGACAWSENQRGCSHSAQLVEMRSLEQPTWLPAPVWTPRLGLGPAWGGVSASRAGSPLDRRTRWRAVVEVGSWLPALCLRQGGPLRPCSALTSPALKI